jgi:hypothetical protein
MDDRAHIKLTAKSWEIKESSSSPTERLISLLLTAATGLPAAEVDGIKDRILKEGIRVYNVFLAHPKSAGHGLTLTKGTYTLWASPTYSAELLRQGKQRVYRNTQQSKTENIILLGTDTVDQFAHERCNDRTMRGAELNSYLENYRK